MNDAMPTIDKKQNINIRIADVKPFALSIPAGEEALYRESEKLVNTLWNKWMIRFKGADSSEEVMAKVAFQFARLYSQAYRDNKATNEFLTEFEKELDEIVVKI